MILAASSILVLVEESDFVRRHCQGLTKLAVFHGCGL